MSPKPSPEDYPVEELGSGDEEVRRPYCPAPAEYRLDCQVVDWVRRDPAFFFEGGRWLRSRFGPTSHPHLFRDIADEQQIREREIGLAGALIFSAVIMHEGWTQIWDLEQNERRARAKAILVAHWLLLEPRTDQDAAEVIPWVLREFSDRGVGRQGMRDTVLGASIDADGTDTVAQLRESWRSAVGVAVIELERTSSTEGRNAAAGDSLQDLQLSGNGVHSFVRDPGGVWRIQFDEERANFSDALGFAHIHSLLRAAPDPVPTWVLAGGTASTAQLAEAMDERGLGEISNAVRDSFTIGDAAGGDRNALSRAQRDFIQAYLRGATAKDGTPRRLNGEMERQRKRVGKAINEAIDKLRATMPKFHSHLRDAIHEPSGLFPQYKPSRARPVWLLA